MHKALSFFPVLLAIPIRSPLLLGPHVPKSDPNFSIYSFWYSHGSFFCCPPRDHAHAEPREDQIPRHLRGRCFFPFCSATKPTQSSFTKPNRTLQKLRNPKQSINKPMQSPLPIARYTERTDQTPRASGNCRSVANRALNFRTRREQKTYPIYLMTPP